MARQAHHPNFTCSAIDGALDTLDLRSSKMGVLDSRIVQTKTVIIRNGGGIILPATEEHLTLLKTSLCNYVSQSQPVNGAAVESFIEAKKRLKVQIRQLQYLEQYYDNGKGSFCSFMTRKSGDSLDSNKSDDSGRGTSNDEQNRVAGDNSPMKQTVAESLSPPLDQVFIANQISKIRQSIPSDEHSVFLLAGLRRLDIFAVKFLRDALLYDEVPGEISSQLRALRLRADCLERYEYQRILTLLGQWNVLGIITFLEEEIFPQHSTYNFLLDDAVREYCVDKSILEVEISPDQLRRLKWRTAAEDVRGTNVLARLKQARDALEGWTTGDLADYISRLASEAGKRSWLGFNGEPTVADEVMAAGLDWITNNYRWKGYGIIAMGAVCSLIPVSYPRVVRFHWFDTPLVKKCRDDSFQEPHYSFEHFCEQLAACLESKMPPLRSEVSGIVVL